MKKFKFPLEAALNLREQKVESERQRLLQIQMEWNGAMQKQQTLSEEVRSEESALRQRGTAFPADQLRQLDRFRAGAQRKRAQLAQEASHIASRLATQQHVLREAERDKELLIRLREKAKARWQSEMDKELDAIADEAFLSRWAARR